MISSSIIQWKCEQDVSMSLWHNWLYRRLLLMMTPAYWSIGVLDFCAGRDTPRRLRVGSMSCYVLFGQGHHEQENNTPTTFSAGTILTLDASKTQTFECDTLARFVVLTSEAPLGFNWVTHRLAPGSQMVGNAASCYLINGTLLVRASGGDQKIESATAFSIAPQIEYTVENIGKNDAQLIGIGIQATANYGANGAAFAQK